MEGLLLSPAFSMRFRSFCISLAFLGLLAACRGPMDTPLQTGEGAEAYHERLGPLSEQMTPEQLAAFNWAVSDLSIELIHERYPNASARQIIHGESALVLDTYPAKIAELLPQQTRYNAHQAQLAQLSASNVQFKITDGFHGFQPYITADFHNGSGLSFTNTAWVAELYINGSEEKVASTSFSLNHSRRNGFVPGETENHTYNVGFVTGDAEWITLEIRNATQREVRIWPSRSGHTDLGDRGFDTYDPSDDIERLQSVMAAAEKYKAI